MIKERSLILVQWCGYVHAVFTSSFSGGLTKPNLTSGEASSQQEARKLTRNFSLEERDSSGVDQKDLSNLQKVSLHAVLCCTYLKSA